MIISGMTLMTGMTNKEQLIEDYDIKKLEKAERLCSEVYGYYYSSVNSGPFCRRLETIIKKLELLIATAKIDCYGAMTTGVIETKTRATKRKRKYYRHCGVCGERHEQSDMIRTDESPNGWICEDCSVTLHPEYDCDE